MTESSWNNGPGCSLTWVEPRNRESKFSFSRGSSVSSRAIITSIRVNY